MTSHGEDLCHDLAEHFLNHPAPIEKAGSDNFVKYFKGAAFRQVYQKRSAYNKKYHRQVEWQELQDVMDDERVDDLDLGEIIMQLDTLDQKILAIFAVNQNISDISRRTLIERHTLTRLIKNLKLKINERAADRRA